MVFLHPIAWSQRLQELESGPKSLRIHKGAECGTRRQRAALFPACYIGPEVSHPWEYGAYRLPYMDLVGSVDIQLCIGLSLKSVSRQTLGLVFYLQVSVLSPNTGNRGLDLCLGKILKTGFRQSSRRHFDFP